LPQPLADGQYTLLRRGVFDDADVAVYVDAGRSFAFLDPLPAFDYASYAPRSQRLGLGDYRKALRVGESRLEKVRALLPERGLFVEIGAADGAFLDLVHADRPALDLAAIEPDGKTRAARDAKPWLRQFDDVPAAIAAGARAAAIGMFHVFEHLADPAAVLADLARLLAPGGALVIEVPALTDPLLSLYGNAAYEAFYFQRQHPFVYSRESLTRVLTANGWTVTDALPYQRYGIDNHLGWLAAGKPGGNAELAALFGASDASYRGALEADGRTDTIIVRARPAA
jgi:SAM-dependent methyltransferase